MNTQLICVKGQTFTDQGGYPTETKQRIDLQFSPSFAKVKMAAYKAESKVVPGEDPTINSIVISEHDVLSDILFLHCSLWPSTPIALLTSPGTMICPDITLPLLGQGVGGGLHTFSIRDAAGQLSNVQGHYSVLLEFHK